jgi:hypothetical protein
MNYLLMKVSQRKGMSHLAIKYTVSKDGVVKVIETLPPTRSTNTHIREEINIGKIRKGQRGKGTT